MKKKIKFPFKKSQRMKKILLFLLVSTPSLIFAQFTSSIDLVGGFDYTYRTGSPENLFNGQATGSKKKDIPNLGVRFGINYNQRILEKLYLKTGIRYAAFAYSTEKITGLIWGSEIQNGLAQGGTWTPDPALPHEIQFRYEFSFLEIPIIARYEFSEKRFTGYLEGGFSPNIRLKAHNIQETDIYTSTTGTKDSHVRQLQIASSFSIGIQYTVFDQLQFFAQPIFRY